MWGIAEWTLFNALEFDVIGLEYKVLFSKLEYFGIAGIPALWLMFSLYYSRLSRWLTRRNAILLWIVPLITIGLVLTNEWHGLIWPRVYLASTAPGANAIYEHGLWFWISAAVDYAFLFCATFLIVRTAVRSQQVMRWQAYMLAAASIIPWIANGIYLAGLSPVPGLDLTPIGFALTGLIVAWAVFGFGLFNLLPVAREAVFENMPDGVIVLDEQDRIADINTAGQNLLGWVDRKMIGQPFVALLAGWPRLIEMFRDAIEIKTEFQPDPDRPVFVEIHISPLRDARGNLAGRVIVVRDISQRKALEKTRDDLIHTMVHDLRNPLSSIVFSLDLIHQSDDTSEDTRATIDIARSNSERMLTLVNSILEIYRLEQGELPLRREWVSLHSVAANRIRAQFPIINEKKLRVFNRVPAELPSVYVDGSLIGRVLQNLLDNAIKFTPEGGTIEIQTEREEAGKQIVVSVLDTGAGISDDIRKRLFQKFAATGSHRGTGLGLAFCRLVVEAHGGTIGAEARATGGTKMLFTLPIQNKS
jgi:PAS domain S-box-containing protein